MNRLEEFFGRSSGGSPPDDYYEIKIRFETFYVSRETALDVERCLDQLPPPRWIVFRDLTGARHRIVLEHIWRVSESLVGQRSTQRTFDRARREEDKEDNPPWEED
jgi:hypothetical protein